MYHRFVIDRDLHDTRCPGMISVAANMWVDDAFRAEQDLQLGKLIRWFNHYLMAPRVKLPDHSTFWFPDHATRHIAKAIELQDFLRDAGINTRHLVADDLLDIVYRDRYQVAALIKRRDKIALFTEEDSWI